MVQEQMESARHGIGIDGECQAWYRNRWRVLGMAQEQMDSARHGIGIDGECQAWYRNRWRMLVCHVYMVQEQMESARYLVYEHLTILYRYVLGNNKMIAFLVTCHRCSLLLWEDVLSSCGAKGLCVAHQHRLWTPSIIKPSISILFLLSQPSGKQCNKTPSITSVYQQLLWHFSCI